MTAWILEWQRGPSTWVRSGAAGVWFRDRPEAIHHLLLRFPPSCLVKPLRSLRVPAPGTIGIVTSYYEPNDSHPEGTIAVRQGPGSTIRAVCEPDWIEVVGYHAGMTPEVVATLLPRRGDN